MLKYTAKNEAATPYTGIIQQYLNEESDGKELTHRKATFVPIDPDRLRSNRRNQTDQDNAALTDEEAEELLQKEISWKQNLFRVLRITLSIMLAIPAKLVHRRYIYPKILSVKEGGDRASLLSRPDFVFEHPYVTSSYYTATNSTDTLAQTQKIQVDPKRDRASDRERGISSRLAIVRPFCEFDAEGLPDTFACWNAMVPCRAAEQDLGDYVKEVEVEDEWVLFDISINGTGRKLIEDDEKNWECEADYSPESSWFSAKNAFKRCKRKTKTNDYFDDVPADGLRTTSADLFLFYSQTYADSPVAINAVDTIMNEFFSPGGWSRCFDNIYAIEANIPPELDLYIPAAQEELYNWVNGPNRQFEAAFRIIQSGEWGDYDGFYLMEGDSVPVKNYWLDVLLGEIVAYRPFAVLGAQYDGDKWDAFYEKIPISLLHHTNGNGIYNTSHPLLERLVGQLEVEAPCPYNSIPYDYRMSQMWVEGTLGIVPKLATKIMLNEEGQNISLSDNTAMFTKWANRWQDEIPYKFTKAIHNYAATNLIPRHLGPEYVIHGAKLYSPWDPARTKITLVVSEWFFDRSLNLIKTLDSRDHPFEKVIIMIPPSISNDHDYTKYTQVPVTLQFRDAPDFLDLCAAEVDTDWFMITNSYHLVSRHVDLMFTPGKFVPVIPFTPATYPFCLKYPYCKEIVSLAQRWNPKHNQVVLDMDMLYNTKERNAFCEEWRERNGDSGEDLYARHQPLRFKIRGDKIIGPKGPTATDYFAYLTREKKAGMYKMTDRSLYGARAPFVKVYRKEEKLDGMSEDEMVRRLGMTMLNNQTECSCDRFDTEEDCVGSGLGCQWRPLFESCHPPEMLDDGEPICATTEAPTMSPSVSIDRLLLETDSPTSEQAERDDEAAEVSEDQSALRLLSSLFKSREHEANNDATDEIAEDELTEEDDTEEESSNRNRALLALAEDYHNRINEESAGELLVDPSNANRLLLAEEDEEPSVEDGVSAVDSVPSPAVSSGLAKICPTWGPSFVPRQFDDFSPTDSFIYKRRMTDNVAWSSNYTKDLLPGRALHTQHQLVHLESKKGTSNSELELPSPEDIKSRRLVIMYGYERKPLRLLFETSSLSEMLHEMVFNFADTGHYTQTQAKIRAYIDNIFPAVSKVWTDALAIYQPQENIVPLVPMCGEYSIPTTHLDEGVSNADVLMYVNIRDPSLCTVDSKPFVSVCHFDQNMRPLVGSLSICLESMGLQDGKVDENEMLRHIASTKRLMSKFLGLDTSLFQFFREPTTDEPLDGRYVEVSCDDSGTKEVFLSNVIQEQTTSDGYVYYEIGTPTVKQVVRNHFDCQSMTGARLNAPIPDGDGSCKFSGLDLRYHFDEDMTSISENLDLAFSISPLSLAILDDSSWYRANFTSATTPSFGRAAGCGFIYEGCIAKGKVPDYSAGYFCNAFDDTSTRSGCDFTHRNKANCDLQRYAKPPPKHQYFHPESDEFGSIYDDVDYCPMRSKHLSSCASGTRMSSQFKGEFYDEKSRCYETDAGASVCLETTCNVDDKSLSFIVQGKSYPCRYHGEVIDVDLGYSVVCPRIASVCPDLVCPANCSGKGICDYCQETPSCICDNPFDESPGCWDG